MKAAVCREFGRPLTIEDVAVATPGPGEVRVDLDAVAICHSDITYADGHWGGATPAIYGHEAAGIVESVGPGVADLAQGTPVVLGLLRSCGICFHCIRGEENLCIGVFAGDTPFVDKSGEPIQRGLKTGAFAERTVVHVSQVVEILDGVPPTSACLLACGVLTGFGAVVNTAAVPAGATVAVVGLGGVGLGAVQGAVAAGSSAVIGVDLIEAKLETARRFGATISIGADDAVDGARVATAGVGPDYVFVTVGSGQAMGQAMAMVRPGGTVVVVGMPPSGQMTEFETVGFADASLTLIGSKMGSARMRKDVPELMRRYLDGSLMLDEMVTNLYPLDDINEAIEEVRTGSVIRNVIAY